MVDLAEGAAVTVVTVVTVVAVETVIAVAVEQVEVLVLQNHSGCPTSADWSRHREHLHYQEDLLIAVTFNLGVIIPSGIVGCSYPGPASMPLLGINEEHRRHHHPSGAVYPDKHLHEEILFAAVALT